ncbi:MAG: shikimate kinase [Clostridiales bacterium]|nr:shikimate kinase [Clostridiales bacterium]
MKAGLIGDNIRYSFSPGIHSLLGDYSYELWEITPGELDAFMTKRKFDALNVTIPYKKSVIPYLNGISDEAERIGAVNTIINKDGKLYGYNTDYKGFSDMLDINGIEIKVKKVLVLGNGGAAATVKTVLSDRGASEIITVSRSGPDNYTNLERHTDASVIVNTTPLGKFPDTDSCPLESLGMFSKLEAVADLTYNPYRTRLLIMAEEKGCKTAGGLIMLISQAIAAKKLFLNEKASGSTAHRAKEIENRFFRNVILIGMPGCGKSSAGKILAEKLGRQFIDTDAEIEKETGRSPADIIENDGEKRFRENENEALSKNCFGYAKVIATGGGSVTTQKGRDIIRQGGKVVFIDRSPELLDRSDRPLSRGSLQDLYESRIGFYRKTADCTVDGNCSLNELAERIITEVLK